MSAHSRGYFTGLGVGMAILSAEMASNDEFVRAGAAAFLCVALILLSLMKRETL